jgi:hypothetical protein
VVILDEPGQNLGAHERGMLRDHLLRDACGNPPPPQDSDDVKSKIASEVHTPRNKLQELAARYFSQAPKEDVAELSIPGRTRNYYKLGSLALWAYSETLEGPSKNMYRHFAAICSTYCLQISSEPSFYADKEDLVWKEDLECAASLLQYHSSLHSFVLDSNYVNTTGKLRSRQPDSGFSLCNFTPQLIIITHHVEMLPIDSLPLGVLRVTLVARKLGSTEGGQSNLLVEEASNALDTDGVRRLSRRPGNLPLWFARTVVLVEGETEVDVLIAVADVRPDVKLRSCVLNCQGSSFIPLMRNLCSKIKVPSFSLLDADVLFEAKHAGDIGGHGVLCTTRSRWNVKLIVPLLFESIFGNTSPWFDLFAGYCGTDASLSNVSKFLWQNDQQRSAHMKMMNERETGKNPKFEGKELEMWHSYAAEDAKLGKWAHAFTDALYFTWMTNNGRIPDLVHSAFLAAVYPSISYGVHAKRENVGEGVQVVTTFDSISQLLRKLDNPVHVLPLEIADIEGLVVDKTWGKPLPNIVLSETGIVSVDDAPAGGIFVFKWLADESLVVQGGLVTKAGKDRGQKLTEEEVNSRVAELDPCKKSFPEYFLS